MLDLMAKALIAATVLLCISPIDMFSYFFELWSFFLFPVPTRLAGPARLKGRPSDEQWWRELGGVNRHSQSRWKSPEKWPSHVISSSISTSSFTATVTRERRTMTGMKKRRTSRRLKTLPSSQSQPMLNSHLILCISLMQSQCAPPHLKATTVFLLKSRKMNFCLQFAVFFPAL